MHGPCGFMLLDYHTVSNSIGINCEFVSANVTSFSVYGDYRTVRFSEACVMTVRCKLLW